MRTTAVFGILMFAGGLAGYLGSLPSGESAAADDAQADSAEAKSGQVVVLGSPELTAGIPGEGALSVSEIRKWLDDPRNHEPLQLQLPLGLDVQPNRLRKLETPLTRAKIELGRQLFFDTRLSADNTVSCASCHNPEYAYTIPEQFATGVGGQRSKRNPPSLYNRIMFGGTNEEEFWDGHAATIEDAVLIALTDPTEMDLSLEQLMKTLRGIEGYRLQFEKIYGRVTIASVGEAMAAFVRTLVTGPSPHDYHAAFLPLADEDAELLKTEDPDLFERYQKLRAGVDQNPLSESALRGKELYFGEGPAWCSGCHMGPMLTDNEYHNIGIGMDAAEPDKGRYLATSRDEDIGKFKTPPVRNAALTAPYMHDGSLKTLEDVVNWYAEGGRDNPHLDPVYVKIKLTDQDRKDLVEFMKSCTGRLPAVETGRLPE
jgi:cytochrome c peroxidase